jgi:hypothetical protein
MTPPPRNRGIPRFCPTGALRSHVPPGRVPAVTSALQTCPYGRGLHENQASPHGVGFELAVLDALAADTRQMTLGEKVAEVQALQANGGDRKSSAYQIGHVQADNTSAGGTTSRYRIARLKRDHPTIAEALARGEYRSVHAAAKAAGLVRELTPLDYLHRYWRKVSPKERATFLLEMLTPSERQLIITGVWTKVAEVQALQKYGANQHSETGGNDSNVLQRGNTSRYRIACLKRDPGAPADSYANWRKRRSLRRSTRGHAGDIVSRATPYANMTPQSFMIFLISKISFSIDNL